MDPTAQPTGTGMPQGETPNPTMNESPVPKETPQESPSPSPVSQFTNITTERPITTSTPGPSIDNTSSLDSPIPNDEMASMPPSGDSGQSTSRKKQGLLIGVVGFLLLITVGGGIFLATKLGQKAPAKENTTETAETATPTPTIIGAAVSFIEGNVWKTIEENKNALTQGIKIPESTIVETGDDGKITLSFDSGSLLYIGPGSKVTIVNVDPNDMQFTLDRGVVYAFVDSLKTAKFSVVSGTAIISAQGTAFSVEKDYLTGVSVYDSKVTITKAGTETLVEANKRWIEGSTRLITLNTAELETDDFLSWAIQEEIARIGTQTDTTATASAATIGNNSYLSALELLGIEKSDLVKAAFLKTKTGKISTINLVGQKNSDGTVKLSWTPDGLAVSGFKIIWSETTIKPYPGDKKSYTPLFSYEKTVGLVKPGSTWYFRVCEWMGTTCGVYSNELKFSF